MRRLLPALVVAAACGGALAQQSNPMGSAADANRENRDRTASGGKSEWEKEREARDWKEAEVQPPAYPDTKGGRLVEFKLTGVSSFRFFIDPASLAVGKDGVVRYTLVARSPSGYENVTYEGMRCGVPGSYKVFALGREGRWTPAHGEWKEIEPRAIQRWHNELRSLYFCPNRATINTAAEGLDALRRGGHPDIANHSAGGAR